MGSNNLGKPNRTAPCFLTEPERLYRNFHGGYPNFEEQTTDGAQQGQIYGLLILQVVS